MTRLLTRTMPPALLLAGALVASAALGAPALATPGPGPDRAMTVAAAAASPARAACQPSRLVLHAEPVPVQGLTTAQVGNAVAVINAAAQAHVPQRGQTIAVMTAIERSSLGAASSPSAPPGGGLFGTDADTVATAGPVAAARQFYDALSRVTKWQDLPPTLAAHAAQHNLDPQAYAKAWPEAVRVVDALTRGTGIAGLRNLAARAQQVARCQAATVRGRFALNGATRYVGPFPPVELGLRAEQFATRGGNGWFDRCQAFVAQLAGRPFSGYRTALDAWQTFEAEGTAHPVTSPDGVAPPVGAWLYYQDATNPAGHVVAYLGNGQIASTDVFGRGRVGIGPASAITDGPWRMQYLGWAPPWGRG